MENLCVTLFLLLSSSGKEKKIPAIKQKPDALSNIRYEAII
jgi:hypothetical protein